GGAEQAYREVEGKARAYGLVGKVLCWAGVGALMEWHLSLPYWLTFAANGVGLGIALWLPPLPEQKRERSLKPGDVFAAFSASPMLALIMLQGVAIFVMERICQVNLFQPILGSKGFGLASYGWVMSFMSVFEASGALGFRSSRLKGDSGSVLAITAVMA